MCKFYLKFDKNLFIEDILKLPKGYYITSMIINKDSEIVILMKNDKVKNNINSDSEYKEGFLEYFKNPNTKELSINKLTVDKQILINNSKNNNKIIQKFYKNESEENKNG